MKFKIKLPKINIVAIFLSGSKYLRLFIGITAIIIFSYLAYFLYKNLYLTVTQSEKIILLKQEVAPERIDLKEVKRVIDAIDTKGDFDINWREVNNPFRPQQQTSPPPSPPSSSAQ